MRTSAIPSRALRLWHSRQPQPRGRKLEFVNLYGDATGTPADHAGEGMTCSITGP